MNLEARSDNAQTQFSLQQEITIFFTLWHCDNATVDADADLTRVSDGSKCRSALDVLHKYNMTKLFPRALPTDLQIRVLSH